MEEEERNNEDECEQEENDENEDNDDEEDEDDDEEDENEEEDSDESESPEANGDVKTVSEKRTALRRQKWGPQKRRRKRSKKFFGRTKREWLRFLTEWAIFYTTFFFVLLLIFSTFSLIFLVPFFIDPAWSTLQADFDPDGTLCTTLSGKYVEGRSHCEWSSCEEGCTKTIFTCWQIEVEYVVSQVGEPTSSTGTGRLFPNIKGCGYPPRVNCSKFVTLYGKTNESYTCFVSRLDPNLVIVDLDLSEVKRDLFYSLAVPIPCILLAIAYLLAAYMCIYNDKKGKKPYRPVASTAAGAALAALLELSSKEESCKDESTTDDKRANHLTPTELRLSAVASALEKERQRRLLLKVTKTKLLAAKEKLPPETAAKASLIAAAVIATAAPKSKSHWPLVVPGLPAGQPPILDLSKIGSIRLRELQEAHMRKYGTSQDPCEVSAFSKIQEYRQQYGAEKYKVMQYYQYYPPS